MKREKHQKGGPVGGGGGTVTPYPCKSGGIYPLSLNVPRLLSLKVLPFFIFYPLSPKVFRHLSPIPQIIYPVILIPKTANRAQKALKRTVCFNISRDSIINCSKSFPRDCLLHTYHMDFRGCSEDF